MAVSMWNGDWTGEMIDDATQEILADKLRSAQVEIGRLSMLNGGRWSGVVDERLDVLETHLDDRTTRLRHLEQKFRAHERQDIKPEVLEWHLEDRYPPGTCVTWHVGVDDDGDMVQEHLKDDCKPACPIHLEM